MKPSEAFAGLEPAKSAFGAEVIRALQAVAAVKSITFTGSFVDKAGLTGISDIDLVVIVDVLTAGVFAECRAAAARITPATLGLPGHHVVINDTFGPLKFDMPGVVVVHLMVYDLSGHREHVLKSPFTCLDWERSSFYAGPSLRMLYPVLPLQPRQFFEARRSLGNYLEDIASGVISYRRHDFTGGARREILERLPLDRRHQGEYAFHIVRNLVSNYAKLLLKENRQLSPDDLVDFWRRNLPGCGRFIEWFSLVSATKHARSSDFPHNTAERTREFLDTFSQDLEQVWVRSGIRHRFIRHARTALNDGSFLGQRRDPPIDGQLLALDAKPQHVFSSPALRCRQTAAALAPSAMARTDTNLHEIDYGEAEGLSFAALRTAHPAVPQAWDRGEDAAFPGGENTAAVAARLDVFLSGLPRESSLVVTHNVVLRCLVGRILRLPLACWHRIPIAHLESFEIVQVDNGLYLDLSAGQIAQLSDALAGHIP